MKQGLNKIFLIVPIFLFGLFFISSPVKAVNLTDVSLLYNMGTNFPNWVNHASGFLPKVNNISGFSIANTNNSLNQTLTFDFYICKGTTTQSTLIFQSRSTSTEAEYGCGTTSPDIRIFRQMSSVMTDTAGGTTFSTSTMNFTPVPLTPNEPYYFVMHYLAGQRNLLTGSNYNNYLATSSDLWFYNAWWNGQQRQIDNSGGTNGVDATFATWYDYGLNEAKMTILQPTNGQRVLNGQPLTIEITIQNPDIAYNGGVIKLLNKKTWTALQDIWLDISVASGTASINIPFTDLELANYRVYGYLYNTNTGQQSTSSNSANFVVGTDTVYVGEGDAQYVKGGEASEAQICGGINYATSSFMWGFECAGRKLIYYSFTPNVFAMETLQESWVNFKNQFPFSIFYDLTTNVQNAIAQAELNNSGTLDVVMINKNREIITVPVLSSSSMPNLIGQTNTNLIRNTISWIMWCGFAFLAYLTFKKI